MRITLRAQHWNTHTWDVDIEGGVGFHCSQSGFELLSPCCNSHLMGAPEAEYLHCTICDEKLVTRDPTLASDWPEFEEMARCWLGDDPLQATLDARMLIQALKQFDQQWNRADSIDAIGDYLKNKCLREWEGREL